MIFSLGMSRSCRYNARIFVDLRWLMKKVGEIYPYTVSALLESPPFSEDTSEKGYHRLKLGIKSGGNLINLTALC